ncbi:MAG: OmpH family outer membrane protein [Pseudomonadota bacterium]
MRIFALAFGLGLLIPAAAIAQTAPVLTLNQEALYLASDFGKRVQSELEQQSRALASENRRIETELVDEERALTEQRPDMEPAAFRELADEFDQRVTEIRDAQDAKLDAIQDRADAERARFYELAFPVLLELVESSGAVAILNSDAVIFSVRNIDITEEAIAAVNTTIGSAPRDGAQMQSPAPRPNEAQEPVAQDEPTLGD